MCLDYCDGNIIVQFHALLRVLDKFWQAPKLPYSKSSITAILANNSTQVSIYFTDAKIYAQSAKPLDRKRFLLNRSPL